MEQQAAETATQTPANNESTALQVEISTLKQELAGAVAAQSDS
eukprot:SAG31_NODE_8628_length_1417_cov_1.407436_3_plen_42_part_01